MKRSWVTRDVLDLGDERTDLKKKLYEAEEAKEKEGSKQEDSQVSEESKGGLDRFSKRGD